MQLITIFTPTFNRVDKLTRLYESLIKQTCKDFIWLIVDDGSTDETFNYVQEIINEKKIKISYHYQVNSGKYIAHNLGVSLSNTKLFCCVDSDDFLTSNAIELVKNKWEKVITQKDIIGILALKSYLNGNYITKIKKNVEKSTLQEAYRKKILEGDTMLIYRTEIIKNVKFPTIENEFFFPEVYLYDLLDEYGELSFLAEALYMCEYLENGYTNNLSSIIKQNPTGYLLFLKNRIELKDNLIDRLINTIKYSGLCIAINKKYDLSNVREHKILFLVSYVYSVKRFGYK